MIFNVFSFSFSFFRRKSFFFSFFLYFFQIFFLLALVSEFICFLCSRCSMEMWCPDDMKRDGWDLLTDFRGIVVIGIVIVVVIGLIVLFR